ncbi:HET-C-related protein [Pseudomonas faucium]|uniref:HET-C-related protein n=1 Tax=Pseudomonas faucium TaxID=2740518 RepID=UPI001F2238E7|nr:HET-C-related protein [Pseudomonas faucium]
MSEPLETLDDSSETTFTSSIALEQLGNLANTLDAQLFTHLFRSVFGTDFAPAAFVQLQRNLADSTLANPAFRVETGLQSWSAYDPDTGEIRVQREVIDQALEEPELTATFLLALIQVFALHVHQLLCLYQEAEGIEQATEPPREDLGVTFAQTLLFYNEPIEAGKTFAIFTHSGTETPLVLAFSAQEPPRADEFSAGRGEKKANHSFGHESIEDALEVAGFDAAQRKAIYFGNWLRDYSQLIDPKLVHPVPGAGIDTADIIKSIVAGEMPRVSREKLTAIVDLFALKEFHSLQQTPEDRALYQVTPKMLGVYRAHEHIDNPTTLDRDSFDPRSIDKDFTALVFPEDKQNALLPKRSMKRYIRRPIAFMIKQLEAAKKEGMTAKGMRYFGEALHVLEDYFAHSNFIELSLKKLGHDDVLVWTTRVEARENSRHEWPVITGMFGALDIVGSVADPMANLLYGDESSPTPGPGERSDFDQVMLILLKDEDPLLLNAYELYLKARDNIRNNEVYRWFNKLNQVIQLPNKAIDYATNLIKKPLLKWAGDHIATLQTLLDTDPNNDASSLATHSQLAKDHDTHPFHTLAVLLAAEAVKVVGQAMYDHWRVNGSTYGDPRVLAEGMIVHPNDTDRFDQIVKDWAQANAERVEQGKSIETLRQLQTDELDEAMKAIGEALDTVVKHIEEIEELTDTSYWSLVNGQDAGPSPFA